MRIRDHARAAVALCFMSPTIEITRRESLHPSIISRARARTHTAMARQIYHRVYAR